ncbi:hypothetical protein SmJEL517_g00302 [Synchytrium microbalum]|uniref:Mediator of RNA polymerase II transcription subunit 14 n=1 Tax=Synchytrium microbalum TaxID=1806994 RepID=A0A507CG29_9FUNG|nr:uncharacterized protein SmJEL517_g00302 [Synchytrium microbalum]TPX38318.1 hypothetical protein SmJEL517_g00302 [Synchytrium microbalum]
MMMTEVNGVNERGMHGSNEVAGPPTIPYKLLLGRMIQEAYSELTTLTTSLPTRSSDEKKQKILEYCKSTREQFIRLLVLLNWGAKEAQDVNRALEAIRFIQEQDACFTAAADELYHLRHSILAQTTTPAFDVHTAVDVLTTGEYRRLPSIIKSVIPLPPLSQSEIQDTIAQLEDVIRMRLLCDEVVPVPMRVLSRIGNPQSLIPEKGSVIFRVKDEFEITLSLPGSETNTPWRLLDLKFLAQAVSDTYENVRPTWKEHQMTKIGEITQKMLYDAAVRSGWPPATAAATVEAGTRWPLVAAYEYLHAVCLGYQLEILHQQALFLAKTRWKDHLRVIIDDKRRLKIPYWAGASTTSLALTRSSTLLHYLEISIADTPSLSQVPNSHIITVPPTSTGPFDDSVHPDVLKCITYGDDTSSKKKLMRVRCFSKADAPIETPEIELVDVLNGHQPVILDIDSSKLDVESLLTKATEYQARAVIKRIYEILVGPDTFALALSPASNRSSSHSNVAAQYEHRKRKRSIVEALSYYSPSDVTILPWTATPPGLVVRFKSNHAVRVGVDTKTGRIVVCSADAYLSLSDDTSLSAASSNPDRIRHVEERLNQNIDDAVVALRDLGYATLIDAVEASAGYLSLETRRDLNSANLESLGTRHVVFLKVDGFDIWWMAIGVLTGLVDGSDETDYARKRILDSGDVLMDGSGEGGSGASGSRDKVDEGGPGYKVWMISTKPGQLVGTAELDFIEVLPPPTPPADATVLPEDLLWKSMTTDTISRLASACHRRISLSSVRSQLQSRSIPFKYYLPHASPPVLLSPSELPYEESKVGNHRPRICIDGDYFAALYYDWDPLDDTMDDTTPPDECGIGSVFIWVEAAPSSGSRGRGSRVCAVGRMKRGFLPSIAPPVNSVDGWEYDANEGMVKFLFDRVDGTVALLLEEWKHIAIMARLAAQAHTYRRFLNAYGVAVVRYDLLTLHIRYHENLLLAIHWERSSDTKPRYKTTLSTVDGSPNPHSITRVFLESILNQKQDIRYLLAVVTSTTQLLSWLSDFETRRNQPSPYQFQPARRNVNIIARSAFQFRIVYQPNYCVEITMMLPSKEYRIVDAAVSYSPTTHEPSSGPPIIPKPDLTTVAGLAVQHMAFQPIHIFAIDLQDHSWVVNGVDVPENSWALPVPGGIIASNGLLLHALRKAEVTLEAYASLTWLYHALTKMMRLPSADTSPILQLQFGAPRSSSALFATRKTGTRAQIGLKRPDMSWTVQPKFIANTLNMDGVRAEELDENELGGNLTNKLQAVPRGDSRVRGYLEVVAKLLCTPAYVIKDIFWLLKLEKVPLDSAMEFSGSPQKIKVANVEWCFTVPEGAPAHVGAVGECAVQIDLEKQVLRCLFKFWNISGTAYVPLSYWYGATDTTLPQNTGLLTVWRDNDPVLSDYNGALQQQPHPGFPTRAPPSDSPLYKAFKEESDRKPFVVKFVDQVSTGRVPANFGGPGKLYPIAQLFSSPRVNRIEDLGLI